MGRSACFDVTLASRFKLIRTAQTMVLESERMSADRTCKSIWPWGVLIICVMGRASVLCRVAVARKSPG
jgi:hypothetical protein